MSLSKLASRGCLSPRLLEEDNIATGLVGKVKSKIVGRSATANVSLKNLYTVVYTVLSLVSIHGVRGVLFGLYERGLVGGLYRQC